MIDCVRMRDVLAHLGSVGFVEIVPGPKRARVFDRADGARVSIRKENVHGYLTELTVNDAFYAAGLEPPHRDTFFSTE